MTKRCAKISATPALRYNARHFVGAGLPQEIEKQPLAREFFYDKGGLDISIKVAINAPGCLAANARALDYFLFDYFQESYKCLPLNP
jgi:hypothetical protein